MRGDITQVELREIKEEITIDKAGNASRGWTMLISLCDRFGI